LGNAGGLVWLVLEKIEDILLRGSGAGGPARSPGPMVSRTTRTATWTQAAKAPWLMPQAGRR